MELKPGYKQTEVGVIPVDWHVVPLWKIAERVMVGIASAATHAYRDKGVVMFRNQNIKPGYLDDSDVLFISEEYEVAFKNKRLKSGDLLTARTGYPGTTSIVPAQYEGAQSFTTLITRPRKGEIDSRYLCCFINSESGQLFFEQNQIGGGQKNVNAGTLKTLPIPVPPTKAEQEAIAEALSDADALIESLDQLLVKKRQIKQGTMQELLTGQRRLPGFSGAWSEVAIKKIVQTPVTDGPHMTPKFLDDGVPFLSVNNLVDNKIDFSDLRYISAADHENFSRKCKPKKNDILLGKAASVGKVAIVDTEIDFNIWSPIAMIRINENNDARFICYQIQSAELNKQIALLTNSSSQGNIGMGDIERLMLLLPEIDEQTAIATILSDMDTELAALEARLAKARHLKQGMMQELLTGRIRLL